MNKNSIISCPDTILNGTFPYVYGDSNILSIGYNRIKFLLGYYTPPKKDLNKRIMHWGDINREEIKKSYKNSQIKIVSIGEAPMSRTIVNLPFQRLFLDDLIKGGFLKLKLQHRKLQITIPNRTIEKINAKSLRQDLAREILLVFFVGFSKSIITYRHLEHSLSITLVYALFIGLIKGLVKSLADNFIYQKKNVVPKMLPKCLIDISAEVITALSIVLSGKEWCPASKGGLKGLLKYMLKHSIQRTTILMTINELSLEIFQSAFKAYLRAYSYSMLINYMPYFIPTLLRPILCCYPGALLGALLMNIFIDQCIL